MASVPRGSARRTLTSPNTPLPVSQGALGHLLPLCNVIKSTVSASAPSLSCPHLPCLFWGPVPSTRSGPSPGWCSVCSFLTLASRPEQTSRRQKPRTPTPSLRPLPFPPQQGCLGGPALCFHLPAGSNKRHFSTCLLEPYFPSSKAALITQQGACLSKDFRTKGVKPGRAGRDGCQAHSSRGSLPKTGPCRGGWVPGALLTGQSPLWGAPAASAIAFATGTWLGH